ncbi:MAG: autotransporter outer membrane beta-barrel domain-containing protein, partial [Verrucomicrobia bacterium]
PAAVAAPVTIFVIDQGAIFSVLQSGLPLAVSQREILLNTIQTVLQDIGDRLFRLRAGLLLDDENPAGVAGPTGREIVRRGSDGKTMSAGKDYKAAPEELFRRWELFAGGDFSKFDVDDTGSLRGHDSEVAVGTVGAEYRLNRHVVFGLAASYIKSDTDISRNIGGMTVEGMAFSAYGSAVWRDFYFDLLYSYGALDEDIQRRTLIGRAAHGDVENRSNALQFNTGYTLRFGPVRTGPLASLEWIHGALEGYRETGGGSAALDFPGQTYDSLVSRLGWQASYTAKTGFGTITPQVRASWDHEYLNSTDAVSASLLSSPFTTITGTSATTGGKFSAFADTAQPGRDFLNLGTGLSAHFGDRVSATVQYETHLFQSSASAHLASVRFSVAF